MYYGVSTKKINRRPMDSTNDHRVPYPEIAMDVIRISDIVLEICDARFFNETRNKEFEDLVIKSGKKLMYVLNKSDLVDMKEVEKNVELHDLQPHFFISCKTHHGILNLRNMIKREVKGLGGNYKRAHIGVIGYPNMGKSSVINLLVGGRPVAKIAAEAGFTKSMQKLRLAKGILLIDTPGIIPQKETRGENKNIAKHSKMNVQTWDHMKSPEISVFDLMKKYPGVIENFYGIECEGNFDILIEKLGRKKNLVKKGNEVDLDRTVRAILKDWQKGRIKQKN